MPSHDLVDLAEMPTDRPYVFVRNLWKGKRVITLLKRVGPDEAKAVWAQVFDEVNDQASMFYWLCSREDSWPVWGAIAVMQGREALTRHLEVHRRRDEFGKCELD